MLRDEFRRFKSAPPTELRKFGLVVGGLLVALGFWFLLRHKPHAWPVLGPGLGLVCFGLIAPAALRWVYVVWMSLAVAMGLIVSTILLTGMFYLVMTPLGWLARLKGVDFLNRRLDRSASSYWHPRERRSPKSAEEWERQF